MRVLFVSSEVFPLVKTGGLADVSGALPAALVAAGVDARVLMPGYPAALEKAPDRRRIASLGDPLGVGGETSLIEARLPDTSVPLWLLDCPALFDRPGGLYQQEDGQDFPDNALRFGLLSWAAAHLSRAGGTVPWRPDVLHANDWQAGLAAAYLWAWDVGDVGTLFTIHNIAYQGQFPKETLPRLGLPWNMYAMDGLEYYDQVSFLKAGLFYSDRISTVSRRYAKEIQAAPYGCGMEGLLSLRAGDTTGILNGADYSIWDPAIDPHLVRRYRPTDRAALQEGKRANKAALQAELGLAPDAETPLFVVVSRLNDLKGMDLLLGVLPAILQSGGQLAVLGTGDRGMEEAFRAAAANAPKRVAVRTGYSEVLAHRLMAAGDMLLMPSRFEPCGLTQFYAFRYGTVPVAHAVGGLADTVMDTTYDSLMTGSATGFVFEHANTGAFKWCLERAIAAFRRKDDWQRVQTACVAQNFGWSRAAEQYVALYKTLAGGVLRREPAE